MSTELSAAIEYINIIYSILFNTNVDSFLCTLHLYVYHVINFRNYKILPVLLLVKQLVSVSFGRGAGGGGAKIYGLLNY